MEFFLFNRSVLPGAIGVVLCLNTLGSAAALAGDGDGTNGSKPAAHSQAAVGARDSLAQEAIVLQAQAARLDGNLQRFSLHAAEYKQSALHRQINNPGGQAAQDKQGKEHLNNVNALREHYTNHVTQYRALVDDYRKFYAAYNEHWQRYQALRESYRQDNERAEANRSSTAVHLSAVANADQLLKAEAGITEVLKRMDKLEMESPTLSESYLCPAYEDLQKEFVQAIGVLQTSISAVPADQRTAVAHEEISNLQQLQAQMADAQALHDEQEQLQAQFSDMMQQLRKMQAAEQKLGSPPDVAP